MGKILDPHNVALETVSPLWSVSEVDGEQVFQVTNNLATTDKTGTAAYLEEEHLSKIALIGGVRRNYRMQAEMRFLKSHKSLLAGGWFGFAIRAQDFLNYEVVWFMPHAEPGSTAAYVPVAHGIVPWWTEAYTTQKKGGPAIPADAWIQARVDVVGDEFTVYVADKLVFTKKLTYYFKDGRPGLFVGTATDAAFRRIVIEDLP
ncbi:MAG: hypothetical protein HYX80_04940 [Chloroflexi bacterium]|nr:hypothetical protein [Chloroflexota bacterium]